MVSRREKLSRTYQRLREQTFYKQAALLSDTRISLSTAEINSIKEANHGPSIYDRLYSHANAPDLSTDFETMVLRIAGRSESELSPGRSFNGYVSGRNGKRFNGDYGKGGGNSGLFESLSSSASEMEAKTPQRTADLESDTRSKVNNRTNKSQRQNSVENRTKNTGRRRKKTSPGHASPLSTDPTSSSDDDDDDGSSRKSGSKPCQKPKKTQASKTSGAKKQAVTNNSASPFQKRFLGGRSSSISPAENDEDDESDQDKLLRRTKTPGGFIGKNAVSKIYSSDSDSATSSSVCNSDAEETKCADSKQVRTKASMKEFSAAAANSRTPKDRSGSNGINKSVSILSSSASSTASSASKNATATEKRRRMDKLFNEESDDESKKPEDSDSEVFAPQRKSVKTGASKARKNESREKEAKSSAPEAAKKSAPRKDCAKDDVFDHSAEKAAQSLNSSSNYDTLTLVPQRAAAKKAIKAIEHIKNGMVKPPTVFEEADDSLKAAKVVKMSALPAKKEAPPASKKIADEDKTSGAEKRPKSSATTNSSPVRSPAATVTTASLASASAAVASHFTSKSSTSAATAAAAPVAASAPVVARKSPSSSSSSYSSSSSSSSSSSDSSSSGESSSSSNSSSSSGSSSSSSESEAEDDVKSNSAAAKAMPPMGVASSISAKTSSPASRAAEREKRAAEGSEKRAAPSADDREECPASLPAASNEQKSGQPAPLASPVHDSLKVENYSHTAEDHSSFTETKAAIENLTNDEQNFLSNIWESAAAATATDAGAAISNSKNDVMHVVDDDDDEENASEKHSSPLLPALPNRSLFSPQLMKDIDLSSFDDMNENNNLTDGSNMSLMSLAGLNFDTNFAFKESAKEDSARETNKLVEKLKQEMARKQYPGNDQLDLAPDALLNHIDDNVDTEISDNLNSDKLAGGERTKKDDDLSDSRVTRSQQEQSFSVSSDSSMLLPESDPSLKVAQPFTGPSEDVILPKENLAMNDTQSVAWPPSERRFDDGPQSSPYTQEMANAPDRWSESVVLPSRRSDCSSASVSSRSSSSSTYSEHANQQTSHADDVGVPRLEPPLELPQHLHKSVADFLRPAADNLFGPAPAGNSLPDMYSYDEHPLPFVKSFDPPAPITPDSKSLFAHSGVPSQAMQPPPPFSMSGYDSVAAFTNATSLMNNAFSQPLSVATASFTTTSQNMAIIASIISPVAPPPLHSDETPTAATPVSSESATFEDKSANSSTSDASMTVPCLEKSLIEEVPPPTPQLPQPEFAPSLPQLTLTQPCLEESGYLLAEKEKENIFTNANDKANNAASTPPAAVPVAVKETPPSVSSVAAKSPASSGVSPAQLEPVVTKGRTREPSTRKSQRNNNKNTSNRRGRGRGRGRGRSRNANCYYRYA